MQMKVPPELEPLLPDLGKPLMESMLADRFWAKFEAYRRNGLQPLESWDRAQALASFVVGAIQMIERVLHSDIADCKSGVIKKENHRCSGKKCWIVKGLCCGLIDCFVESMLSFDSLTVCVSFRPACSRKFGRP